MVSEDSRPLGSKSNQATLAYKAGMKSLSRGITVETTAVATRYCITRQLQEGRLC